MTERSSLSQEPDAIDGARTLWIVLVGVLVGAAAVVSSRLLHRNAAETSPPWSPSGPAFAASTPERALFDGHERGVSLRSQQARTLNQYGWADRAAGTAQIPIERAIELELAARR